jgi:hypothetical protein
VGYRLVASDGGVFTLREEPPSEPAKWACLKVTYGFQAPGFYEKLGYREFGRLDKFPPGFSRLFYWKPLPKA